MSIKVMGKTVMVEPVLKEKGKIIIPDSAKEGAECDVIVRAVGPGVKNVRIGDKVVCRPNDGKPLRFDAGVGVKTYSFFDEADILGKF